MSRDAVNVRGGQVRPTPRGPLIAGAALLVLIGASAGAQRGRVPAAAPLPPLSMTCPHHPDVIQSEPGTCPICKLALVPVRLAPAYTCPVHAATIADAAGTCPICRRTLVPVTVSLTWSCGRTDDEHLERGTCPDGRPMALKRTLRPHGDHNPRHGGQFFMASDNWHHVEGVLPSEGVFRLHVYDEFGRPLSADRLGDVRGRLVTSERFDPATRQYVELTRFPLEAARGGYLEARVKGVRAPAEMTAKVRFARGGQEYRFDFTFMALTKEPAAPAAIPRPADGAGGARPDAPRAAATPRPASGATRTAAPETPLPATASAPGGDPALASVPIPESVPGILEQLKARDGHVAALIARGDFGAVWVPAFAAKELALALEPHLAHLNAARRDVAAPALERVVRLAWLLDAHGDTGNRQQLLAAHASFSAAIGDVLSTFADMNH